MLPSAVVCDGEGREADGREGVGVERGHVAGEGVPVEGVREGIVALGPLFPGAIERVLCDGVDVVLSFGEEEGDDAARRRGGLVDVDEDGRVVRHVAAIDDGRT